MRKAVPLFRYQLISHRPPRVGSAQEWDDFVTWGLFELFTKEPVTRALKPGSAAYIEMFDAYLIFQAQTIGYRILFSSGVQHRMQSWEREETGPRKYKRLGKAMSDAALIIQRKRKVPITDPDWYPARKMMIEELQLLLDRVKAMALTHPRRLEISELADHCKSIVDQSRFRLLPQHYDNLLDYLKSGADGLLDKLLAGERVSATTFHDNWWAGRNGHDPEKFRQKVSSFGSVLR